MLVFEELAGAGDRADPVESKRWDPKPDWPRGDDPASRRVQADCDRSAGGRSHLRGVLALLAVSLLIACQPAQEKRSDELPDSMATSALPPVPAVAVAGEPDQLVPFLARKPASAAIWHWILPSLVRVETDSTGQARFVGDLATSWQIEDGGKSARFHLAPGRFWEDTTAVDVADVIGTYRLYRSREISGDWADRVREVTGVRRDSTSGEGVVFRFDRPLSRQRILQLTSLPLISIDQWLATEKRQPALGSAGRLLVSAGPFRVAEWVPGDFLRLERHPFPPPGRVPLAERIVLRFIPSARSRAMQFELGAVQLAVDLPPDEVIPLRERLQDGGLIPVGTVRLELLVWNIDDRFWGSLASRRTLRSVLDLGKLQSAFCPEAAPLGRGPLAFLSSPVPQGPDTSGLAPPAAADTASPAFGAGALAPLELLYVAVDPARERVAVELALQLQRVGAECVLTPSSAEECFLRIRARRFQAVLIGYDVAPLPDLGELLASDGLYNIAGLRDPVLDDLVAKARSAASDTIPDIWRQVENRAGELLPCLPLAYSMPADGVGPRLSGYHPEPLQPYGNLLAVR